MRKPALRSKRQTIVVFVGSLGELEHTIVWPVGALQMVWLVPGLMRIDQPARRAMRAAWRRSLGKERRRNGRRG
jgi:hypothetical protein